MLVLGSHRINAENAEPWFPGLAAELLAGRLGSKISGRAYGSERWLTGNPAAPRDIVSEIGRSAKTIHIEAPSPLLEARYGALGLQLAKDFDAVDGALVEQAIDVIGRVSSLQLTVLTLVRSIHALEAEPGFDVSHSDPELPFSIFVSIPTGEAHAGLRLAESIVHETMHLQLTLIEAQCPLVTADNAETLFSPWQKRDRPLGGLLHGVYVFAVIDAFMRILEPVADPGSQAFIARRRAMIAAELAATSGLQDHDGLTEAGRAFLRTLRPGDESGGL